MQDPKGDASSFDANWRNRPETGYLHWTREEPTNQIQLAFRRHWITFNRLLGDASPGKCLEVGCGRGSLSAYFSDAGWDCSLLDLSEAAIDRAKEAFSDEGLTAQFDVGDCLDLPYADNSYDLVFSIGLLEHFEDIDQVISEQVRILRPQGMFIGYVVPELPECVQKDFDWINDILRALLPDDTKSANAEKVDVFRSDALSPPYLKALQSAGVSDPEAVGAYPLPMISHSPEFPFSLLPETAESSLVQHFMKLLDSRERELMSDPWLCDEGYGQAFLVYGRKDK